HDKSIRVWDPQAGRQLHRFIGHTHNWIRSVIYLPDGKRAVSGGFDGIVRLWTVETAKEIRSFPAKPTATAGPAKTAAKTPVPTVVTKTAAGGPGPGAAPNAILCLAVSPDGKYVLAGSRDRSLKLWEIETGKQIRQFQGHQSPIGAVAFSPDGKFAIAGCVGPLQGNAFVQDTANRPV